MLLRALLLSRPPPRRTTATATATTTTSLIEIPPGRTRVHLRLANAGGRRDAGSILTIPVR